MVLPFEMLHYIVYSLSNLRQQKANPILAPSFAIAWHYLAGIGWQLSCCSYLLQDITMIVFSGLEEVEIMTHSLSLLA